MIQIIFGLPGCGKTTLFCRYALRAIKKYPHVYGNVHTTIPGYTYIDNECIGRYNLDNSLILVDEATNFADNRDFKAFSKSLVKFMNEHRHHRCDIIFFLQKWDALDIKIRVMATTVYLVKKSVLFPFLSYQYLIPYGMDSPNPKFDGRRFGDIVMGYSRPTLFGRIFKSWIFRPLYYKYFDSYECEKLPPLPVHYSTNPPKERINLKNVISKLYACIRQYFIKGSK